MRRVVVTGLGHRLIHRKQRRRGDRIAEGRHLGDRGQHGDGRTWLSQPGRGHAQTERGRTYRQTHLAVHGPGAAYAYLAMEQAIADAGLDEDDLATRAPA